MEKDLQKQIDELFDLIHKKAKIDYRGSKDKLKQNVSELIDVSEEVVWCVSDKGVVASGSIYNMLCAITKGLTSMVEDGKISKKSLKKIFDTLLEEEEEEEEKEDILEEIKKIIESEF